MTLTFLCMLVLVAFTVWFQNRRAKWRKEMRRSGSSTCLRYYNSMGLDQPNALLHDIVINKSNNLPSKQHENQTSETDDCRSSTRNDSNISVDFNRRLRQNFYAGFSMVPPLMAYNMPQRTMHDFWYGQSSASTMMYDGHHQSEPSSLTSQSEKGKMKPESFFCACKNFENETKLKPH